MLPVLAAVVAAALLIPNAGEAEGPAAGPDTTAALFVGNNWDGTADVVDPKTFEKLDHFNVVPDLQGAWPRSTRTRCASATSWPSGSWSARATTSSSTTCSAPTTAASSTC